jgi:hypothetical protein
VLGHAIEGVEGVYDQYEYFAEKSDALKKLGALIDKILNSADTSSPSRSGPKRQLQMAEDGSSA